MRALLALALLLPAAPAAASGPIRSDADQSYVPVAQCGEARGYLEGLRAAGVLKDGGWATATAKFSRGDWDGRLRAHQATVIWNLARAATCYDREMLHAVRIVDQAGDVIRLQKVSLDRRCHGDRRPRSAARARNDVRPPTRARCGGPSRARPRRRSRACDPTASRASRSWGRCPAAPCTPAGPPSLRRSGRRDRAARRAAPVESHPSTGPIPVVRPEQFEDADDLDSTPQESALAWLRFAGELIIALAAGVGVYFAATLLWENVPHVAVLLAPLAVTALVAGVGVWRQRQGRDPVGPRLLAILVFAGTLLTIAPAAGLLAGGS